MAGTAAWPCEMEGNVTGCPVGVNNCVAQAWVKPPPDGVPAWDAVGSMAAESMRPYPGGGGSSGGLGLGGGLHCTREGEGVVTAGILTCSDAPSSLLWTTLNVHCKTCSTSAGCESCGPPRR